MALTNQYDLYRMSVGVLYLNLGLAGLEFPTSTRAHPSYQVQVTLTKPPLSEDHRVLFPFYVRWDIWQRVVVPLFDDASVLVKVGAEKNETLRQWINRQYLWDKNVEGLLVKIESLLLDGMIQCGYVPAGTTVQTAT